MEATNVILFIIVNTIFCLAVVGIPLVIIISAISIFTVTIIVVPIAVITFIIIMLVRRKKKKALAEKVSESDEKGE